MRQPYTTILSVLILSGLLSLPSYAAIRGGINYSIPVDYSNLSEEELNSRAENYFFSAVNSNDKTVNENITNALLIYSILQNMNPDKVEYSIKLGRLYEKIDMDRYAKGNFARAVSIDKTCAEAYFYYGEYYYKRLQFKKALKYYKEALNYSKQDNRELFCRLGDIYSKFGDTKNALIYLNKAQQLAPGKELEEQIKQTEKINSDNNKYYQK